MTPSALYQQYNIIKPNALPIKHMGLQGHNTTYNVNNHPFIEANPAVYN